MNDAPWGPLDIAEHMQRLATELDEAVHELRRLAARASQAKRTYRIEEAKARRRAIGSNKDERDAWVTLHQPYADRPGVTIADLEYEKEDAALAYEAAKKALDGMAEQVRLVQSLHVTAREHAP